MSSFARFLLLSAAGFAILGVFVWYQIGPTEAERVQPAGPQLVATFEAPDHGALVATPAVTADRIFVAAIRDTGLQPTGAVHCLDRITLKPLWTFDDGGAMLHMFSSPTEANGRLYIGDGMHANFTCRLYCLDAATGRKLWAHTAGSHVESTPVVVGDRVIVGAGDDGVVCLDAINGKPIWKLDSPAHVDTTPVVGNGVVYAGSGVSRRVAAVPTMFALNLESGAILWQARFDLPVWATPALSGDTLFVGLGNGRLLEAPRPPERPAGAVVALDAVSGEERWRFDRCDAVFGQPAVDHERVYVGSRDGRCYALDRATGRLVWSAECGSPVVAGPVWTGSTLVIAASGGEVIGFDPISGRERWRWLTPRPPHTQTRILSPPAVARQVGQELLYLPTELQRGHGSAGLLYILKP